MLSLYKEIFADYPYDKMLDRLSKGIVDLNTESIEQGQIYLFIRKNIYSNDAQEDLEVVKRILPLQLQTMFSPPYSKLNLPPNYGKNSQGSYISPLPTTDLYLMSCFKKGYYDNAKFSFKYTNVDNLMYHLVRDANFTISSNFLKEMQNQGTYGGTYKDMAWGYWFKIPIIPPIKKFMNWNSNPFI